MLKNSTQSAHKAQTKQLNLKEDFTILQTWFSTTMLFQLNAVTRRSCHYRLCFHHCSTPRIGCVQVHVGEMNTKTSFARKHTLSPYKISMYATNVGMEAFNHVERRNPNVKNHA